MRRVFALMAMALTATGAVAADWPHWLGPRGDGSSPETGLKTTWTSAGPKVLWSAPGGEGYSSIAIAGGKAYTLAQRGNEEVVLAFDAVGGKELWKTPIGPAFKNQYGNGPRSTPWVEKDRVYVQSVTGPLACLDTANGQIVWHKNLLKEFGAKNITWGLSASPVIADNVVLAIPGAKGAGVAAFEKATGKVVWKHGSDRAAYASPVVADVGGKQAIFFNAAGLLAVSLDQGTEMWRVPWKTEFDCNIMTPVLIEKDKLFVSSGEGNGCVLFHLKPSGPPTILWESKGKGSSMINYWANPVVYEGHLYGVAGEFDKRMDLRCVDLKTGKVKWSKDDFGKAAVMLADGHLFVTTKKGELVLVRATADAYEERGRVTLLGENRTVPTLSEKRLYLRDLEKVVCVDLGS